MRIETFGGRMRLVREAMNISQSELAKRLEVAAPTVSRWESNSAEPGADEVPKIARAMGVPASFFFLDEPWGELTRALAEVYRILNEAREEHTNEPEVYGRDNSHRISKGLPLQIPSERRTLVPA